MTEEKIDIKSKTDSEYVFNSRDDMMRFHDDLENGKEVVITYINGDVRVGELILPTEFALIKDGNIKLRYEEKVKK